MGRSASPRGKHDDPLTGRHAPNVRFLERGPSLTRRPARPPTSPAARLRSSREKHVGRPTSRVSPCGSPPWSQPCGREVRSFSCGLFRVSPTIFSPSSSWRLSLPISLRRTCAQSSSCRESCRPVRRETPICAPDLSVRRPSCRISRRCERASNHRETTFWLPCCELQCLGFRCDTIATSAHK